MFLWLDAQSLSIEELHFILPLVIRTFIMQSVAFITSTTSSYKVYFLCTNKSYIFREQFLLLAPITAYLKDLTQSIGRYGGLSWQNWVWGYLEAQVVSLLGARNLASMRGKGKLNMFGRSMTIYFNWDARKHKPLRCLPCPTSTLLACHT